MQDEIFFQLCARSKELASGTAGPLSFVLPLGLLFQVDYHPASSYCEVYLKIPKLDIVYLIN